MKRKKRSNFEKIIIVVLIIILILLLVYAFKDNFTNNTTNINSNATNKVQPSKNTTKKVETKTTVDNEKKEENTKKDSINTNLEPKKEEKDENKQQMQNNITAKLELIGSDEITLKVGEKYKELGVKATDSNGKDISSQVSIENNVDSSKAGEYMVIYSIGKSMVIRNVIVK